MNLNSKQIQKRKARQGRKGRPRAAEKKKK